VAGNKTGGAKAAKTNKELYGADFYARIGAIGGKAKVPKGFAYDSRTFMDKLTGKPKLASLAGKKGGAMSRRGPA